MKTTVNRNEMLACITIAKIAEKNNKDRPALHRVFVTEQYIVSTDTRCLIMFKRDECEEKCNFLVPVTVEKFLKQADKWASLVELEQNENNLTIRIGTESSSIILNSTVVHDQYPVVAKVLLDCSKTKHDHPGCFSMDRIMDIHRALKCLGKKREYWHFHRLSC